MQAAELHNMLKIQRTFELKKLELIDIVACTHNNCNAFDKLQIWIWFSQKKGCSHSAEIKAKLTFAVCAWGALTHKDTFRGLTVQQRSGLQEADRNLILKANIPTLLCFSALSSNPAHFQRASSS